MILVLVSPPVTRVFEPFSCLRDMRYKTTSMTDMLSGGSWSLVGFVCFVVVSTRHLNDVNKWYVLYEVRDALNAWGLIQIIG
jgi:hypothetical protein